VTDVPDLAAAGAVCQALARTSQCQVLTVGPAAVPFAPDGAVVRWETTATANRCR
jgi:hypothetical protein